MMNNKLFILIAFCLIISVMNCYVKLPAKTTFQYQLSGDVDASVNVQVFFIDLFGGIDKGEIAKLKGLGKIVFCYFSAGSFEQNRPDANTFPQSVIAGQYVGYPLERWLNIRNYQTTGLGDIMKKRIDLAAANKCDGVDPDNIDVYNNNKDAGLDITASEQLLFNKFLADYAHSKDLAISMKNDGDQVADLIDSFDVAVNESCYELKECAYLDTFIKQNKAAFGISYKDLYPDSLKNWPAICKTQSDKQYTWILKNQDLLAQIQQCGAGFNDTVIHSLITTPFLVIVYAFVFFI